MKQRKPPAPLWWVEIYNAATNEAITGPRIMRARTAHEAGALIGYWLELEGYDVEARLEVALYEHG